MTDAVHAVLTRKDARHPHHLRPVEVERTYTRYAPGSVLYKQGNTVVLVTATIEDRVPRHLMEKNGEVISGWLTAEYALLPGATHTRNQRERTKLSGRTAEIQRLIGRSLRACVDLKQLGQRTITIDADVLQADGGTRCASITAGFMALNDAIQYLMHTGGLKQSPILWPIAAVSVGVVDGHVALDLDYEEDQRAEVDANIVMNGNGDFIEVQATGEESFFPRATLNTMLDVAHDGLQHLMQVQRQIMATPPVWDKA